MQTAFAIRGILRSMLALFQQHEYFITLGKWWQVLPVLIAIAAVGIWLIQKFSGRKRPETELT